MFTEDKLKEIFQIQYDVNVLASQGSYEEWLSKVNKKKLLFAFLEEFGEYLQSTNYHWWKKKEIDLDNMKMELVDMFHFLVSYAFLQTTYTIDDLSELITKQLTKDDFVSYNDIDKMNDTLIEAIDLLISYVYRNDNDSYIKAFTRFLNAITGVFKSLDEFYELYLTKAVLNKYRYENGYKEGKYQKIINGKEDNFYMKEALNSLKEQRIQITPKNLLDRFLYIIKNQVEKIS